MDNIISIKHQPNFFLSDKKTTNTLLVFKGDISENNHKLAYFNNTKSFIAFSVNENIENEFQVPVNIIV